MNLLIKAKYYVIPIMSDSYQEKLNAASVQNWSLLEIKILFVFLLLSGFVYFRGSLYFKFTFHNFEILNSSDRDNVIFSVIFVVNNYRWLMDKINIGKQQNCNNLCPWLCLILEDISTDMLTTIQQSQNNLSIAIKACIKLE